MTIKKDQRLCVRFFRDLKNIDFNTLGVTPDLFPMSDDDTAAIVIVSVALAVLLLAGLVALAIAFWNYPSFFHYDGYYHAHDVHNAELGYDHHHHQEAVIATVRGTNSGLTIRSTAIASAPLL